MFDKESYLKKLEKKPRSYFSVEWELATYMLNPKKVNPTRLKKISKCKDCPYCERKVGKRGRAFYICSFTNIRDFMPEKYKGYDNLIAFEDKETKEVAKKQRPFWCPVVNYLRKQGIRD